MIAFRSDGSETAVEARFLAGEQLFHQLFRLSDAEQRLREVLESQPGHVPANRLLVELLDLCGRSWEAIPLRVELIRQNASTPADLLTLIHRKAPINREVLRDSARRSPDDPLTMLAVAVAELRSHSDDHAEALLQDVVATAPNLCEAQVRYGVLLWDSVRTQEFRAWNSQLSGSVLDRPEVWALRGDRRPPTAGFAWGRPRILGVTSPGLVLPAVGLPVGAGLDRTRRLGAGSTRCRAGGPPAATGGRCKTTRSLPQCVHHT